MCVSVHCELEQWPAEWSKCTEPCGGGIQSQTRGVAITAKFGGNPCDDEDKTRIQNCNQDVECDDKIREHIIPFCHFFCHCFHFGKLSVKMMLLQIELQNIGHDCVRSSFESCAFLVPLCYDTIMYIARSSRKNSIRSTFCSCCCISHETKNAL